MQALAAWLPNDTIGAAVLLAAAVFLVQHKALGPYRIGAWVTLAGAALWLTAAVAGPLIPEDVLLWMVRAGKALPYGGALVMLGRSREERYPFVALLVLASIPWHFLPRPASLLLPPATSADSYAWVSAIVLGIAMLRLAWAIRSSADAPSPPRALRFAVVGIWVVACVYGGLWIAMVDSAARLIVAPIPRLPPIAPEGYKVRGWERVQFSAEDGIPLVGWWAPGRTPRTVVIVHGHGENKGAYGRHILWLNSIGWSTFVFDYRTHGESGGRIATRGVHEQRDLLAALKQVQARQAAVGAADAPIVVYGLSLGGIITLHVAADTHSIDGVIIEGTSADLMHQARIIAREQFGPVAPIILGPAFRVAQLRTGAWVPGLNNLHAIEQIAPRPVLIIENEEDRNRYGPAGDQLLAAASKPKHYYFAEGTAHVAAFRQDHENYTREVSAFLDSVGTTSSPVEASE